MTADQIAILALLAGLLAAFASGRFRLEVVALSGLALGAALGLVPADRIFSGFANPAVITVVEILLIVRLLSRARLLEAATERLLARLRGPGRARAALLALAAALSSVMNNVGAFALMLPVVQAAARRTGLAPRAILLPVSYATLLGGLCTLIGTPPNLLASEALSDAVGRGFGFFDFALAGVPAALAGLAALLLWAPRVLDPDPEEAQALDPSPVVAELTLPEGSPLVGRALADLPRGLAVRGIERAGRAVSPLWPRTPLAAGDRLLAEADPRTLDALRAEGALALAAAAPARGAEPMQAVISPASPLVGSPAGALAFLEDAGARLVAVGLGPRPRLIEGRLADLRLGVGDVLHLEGPPEALRRALGERDALLLAPGPEETGPAPPLWPLAAFGLGVAAAGFGLADPAAAFGAVLLALLLGGALRLRAGLASLDWGVIVMLAAMIPLGEAAATTGAAASLAGAVASLPAVASPPLAIGAILLLAAALTPLVNNAALVVALAPIAVELAEVSGAPPQPFLIALAAGASLDFLTPFGHHNNTLAHGLGGYRFSDFPRAGWPVLLSAAAAAWAATVLFWT
ncbi:SLC13 family permease [Albimonas pacifica]|uniref:Di-and tricarboxylate transporter n=1 Tax=Albimonas pacifica TaxID=1114924 RepID=A0A1I3NAJ3_9RHOB|nr:SLC13 family permease [Albimonas pacifica]SFJ06328.1 Di-and tricarboxylate transporter [Albimonas pacifica]